MPSDRIILLAEDNDDDAELTTMAFAQSNIANRIIRVRDGVETLDWLFARGSYAGRSGPMPVVVLLDLKMPRMGGLEVLAAIRANPQTLFLPVVVLTSSVEDKDRLTAYKHHANSYVQKPVDYNQFVAAAHQLGLYWTLINLPAPPIG